MSRVNYFCDTEVGAKSNSLNEKKIVFFVFQPVHFKWLTFCQLKPDAALP